jgi:uncharacterized protein YcfJ
MKKIMISLSALALAFGGTSCQTGPNAQMGTAAGALGGALLGGVIGHQSGRGLEGAAIGAAGGAAAGNLMGGSVDARNAQMYNRGPVAPPPGYYSQPAYRY